MPQDRIDQAASVLSSVMHQGDGGRQARELLAFDASTMGRADYEAMVEQVQTTEAFTLNDMMRQGRHDEAVDRLRADANIFVNHEDFMELAGKVRAMNKVSNSPTHLEFNPIYQNGDVHGRPTALEVGVSTRFQNTNSGQQWERRDPVKLVDNRIGEGECHTIEAPPPVVVIQQPAPIIVEQRPQFTFNLEIEIGRERIRRADPRWCPDRNWRPHNAPPGFNLEIEIGRVREDYRRRGDHDWRPERATPRTVINQINNTTIINNTTNIDRSRTTIDNSTTNNNVDRSRTRVDSHDRTNDNDRTRSRQGGDGQQSQPGQQRREAPPQGQDRRGQDTRGQDNRGQDRRAEAEARRAEAEARRAQQNNGQDRQGQDRQAQERQHQRRGEQERQRPDREKEERERRERKKN